MLNHQITGVQQSVSDVCAGGVVHVFQASAELSRKRQPSKKLVDWDWTTVSSIMRDSHSRKPRADDVLNSGEEKEERGQAVVLQIDRLSDDGHHRRVLLAFGGKRGIGVENGGRWTNSGSKSINCVIDFH
jgi:hypothetical protein